MSSHSIFTHPDAWSGGSYELAIELGPPDDLRLEKALVRLWAHPELQGCYLDAYEEPSAQLRVEPGKVVGLETCLRGLASVVGLVPIPCSTVVVRYEDDSDWIFFGLPMGSLGRVLPVGAFPFDDGGDLSWRVPLDGWLRLLAEHLFATVPFQLGLVGSTDGLDDNAYAVRRSGVPAERWVGYLEPVGGLLAWYPPNRGAPMSFGKP